PGEWARQYAVRVTMRTDTNFTDRFKIEVVDAATKAIVSEVFENLSIEPTDGRFVDTFIKDRSALIRVTAGTTTPTDEVKAFTNGADGSVLDPNSTDTGLQAAFHAAVVALFDQGQIADRLDLFNIVCVPGESEKN